MLDRLKNAMNAMLNKGISKMETPEVLAEAAEDELRTNVKKLKEAVVSSVSNEKLLEQQIKKAQEEVATIEKRAAMAVQQGNDDMAKQFLLKKADTVKNYQELAAQLEEQKKTSASLKERYAEMDQKMQEFGRRKSELIARSKASEATAKANELVSNTSTSGMGKWEQKIREKETMNEAVGDLNADKKVEDQFKKLDAASQVDDELAALKASVGAGTPKLIVDKGPDQQKPQKEAVDENVPMVVDVEIKPKSED